MCIESRREFVVRFTNGENDRRGFGANTFSMLVFTINQIAWEEKEEEK